MFDEPRRHPGFLALLAVVVLGTVPLPFVGTAPRLILGIPIWLWWSGLFTVVLSCLTAMGILRYWRDGDVE